MNGLQAVLTTLCILTVITVSCGQNTEKQRSQPIVEQLTFAVYGNTGFSTDGGSTLRKLADALRKTDSAFAVDLGNRLPSGVPSGGVAALWNEVDKDRDAFHIPVYTVAGATDVFDYESDVLFTGRYGPQWYTFLKNGIRFIVLNTEDETYRSGFGVDALIGEEQLSWLGQVLEENNASRTVVFMHRPLWETDPSLWATVLGPLFREKNIDLIITCYSDGLYDWERVEGIRAVSTGCTGPADKTGFGVFPHMIMVTVDADDITFSVLYPDGTLDKGIDSDKDMKVKVDMLTASFNLPPLETDGAWQVSETRRITIVNPFDVPVTGEIAFETFGGTSWETDPRSTIISVEPGTTGAYHLGIRATPPELGPQPLYRVSVNVGDVNVADYKEPVLVRIPEQRTDDPVPIEAAVAEILPYRFGGESLRIPVDVPGYDTCGRCVIYRGINTDIRECVHISALKDFDPGINEFYWNGRDFSGNPVESDTLLYHMFVYNKKAPATWVAEGPPNPYGSSQVRRTLTGLSFVTHNKHTLVEWRIGGSKGAPVPREDRSFRRFLGNAPLTGYTYGDGNRMYLLTDYGVACVLLARDDTNLDNTFGNNGFITFGDYRGRSIGSVSFAQGLLYVGVGGGTGTSPGILIYDGDSGEKRGFIDLGDIYGEETKAPSFTVTGQGIMCAHPDRATIARLTLYGERIWVTESDSWVIGSDTDGRTCTFGVGIDSNGFSYVNTPGYSARCAVVGPDGRGLFRVILVSLPGLRVHSTVPMIEGESTDGLYFVTRGGDKPYVFHVPLTVRSGFIVDEAEHISPVEE